MDSAELASCSDINPELARKTFKFALVANTTEEIFENYQRQTRDKRVTIISQEDICVEVTELMFANREVCGLYASPQGVGLGRIGKMKAKTWPSPYAPEEDLTMEEEAALADKPPEIKHYEFWVEDDVLEKCFVGMKLDTTIRQTSFGVSYFDAVIGVHCSFYRVLANEKMVGWRKPEKEWLPMRKKTNEQDVNQNLDEEENSRVDNAEKDNINTDGSAQESMDIAPQPQKKSQQDTTERGGDQVDKAEKAPNGSSTITIGDANANETVQDALDSALQPKNESQQEATDQTLDEEQKNTVDDAEKDDMNINRNVQASLDSAPQPESESQQEAMELMGDQVDKAEKANGSVQNALDNDLQPEHDLQEKGAELDGNQSNRGDVSNGSLTEPLAIVSEKVEAHNTQNEKVE